MSRVRALNVAEKPSVAKSISEMLGGQGVQSRTGRSQYNRIFDFPHSIRANGGCDIAMTFTSVTGHLMGLDFPATYQKWGSVDPLELFTAPIHKSVPDDKKGIQQTLEQEARRCDWLILWLDCDREGENIAFEVIDVCQSANRNIKVRSADPAILTHPHIAHDRSNWLSSAFLRCAHMQVYRAHFSALIPADIRRALETLTAPDRNLSDAVDARYAALQ